MHLKPSSLNLFLTHLLVRKTLRFMGKQLSEPYFIAEFKFFKHSKKSYSRYFKLLSVIFIVLVLSNLAVIYANKEYPGAIKKQTELTQAIKLRTQDEERIEKLWALEHPGLVDFWLLTRLLIKAKIQSIIQYISFLIIKFVTVTIPKLLMFLLKKTIGKLLPFMCTYLFGFDILGDAFSGQWGGLIPEFILGSILTGFLTRILRNFKFFSEEQD